MVHYWLYKVHNSQCTYNSITFHACCHSSCRCEFAIATSDGQVFVRQFALNYEGMHPVRTLKGHQSEVTQVREEVKVPSWVCTHKYCQGHCNWICIPSENASSTTMPFACIAHNILYTGVLEWFVMSVGDWVCRRHCQTLGESDVHSVHAWEKHALCDWF